MSAGCPDYFAARSADYALFRPHYPEPLFDHLSALLTRRELAWDCATGSGQAVAALSSRFTAVVASDASAAQLRQARVAPNVQLVVASAECVPLPAACVDLITVAQALHWLDLPRFFAEARRVLCPCGVLAIWTYNLCMINPAVDRIVHTFYHETVGPYWPPERRLVDEAYAGVAWPTVAVATTTLSMTLRWTLEHLLRYVGTWSAVQQYRAERADDPLPALRRALLEVWGAEVEREVSWPLTLKTLRLHASA